MSDSEIIMNYESLSSITGKMLEAAINENWDQLIDLEQQCNQHVSTMKPSDAVTKLHGTDRQRKIQLIKKILADDAEIRNRTELWMGQLKNIMQHNRQEQNLRQAYGV